MRLFVGLQPSPRFRMTLAELQTRLHSAGVEGRYLDPVSLHMTLAYIGEWPDDVTDFLPCVERPFRITLTHLGVFTGAKVLWAGVAPSKALDSLAEHVRGSLASAGVPYDRQAFNPHITLVRKPFIPGDAFFSDIQVPRASMTVGDVCLYRSVHGEHGMEYPVIGRKRRMQ